ncbi:MAG: Ig-like domain-containing protein [Candidatus Limnocylindrales bacterium]
MGRVLAVLVTASVLGGSLLGIAPARASAASATDNIPGLPLPAPEVTGQLGGPIYDVIYSVEVPAAHVLLVSLTGTAGTDFDLYLFDSTATDIYAVPPVGLVATSTGPTSTESIKYSTIPGGLFYIDVSGATNVEGTFRLSVTIAKDTAPPVVSLSLDGGAPATNSTTVTATVIATDDLSGVAAMQLSDDGSTWSAWQPYSPTVPWTFPTGDGPKELWVRVRDGAGNVSALAHATIQLITVAPVVVARHPDPADPITGTRSTITVTFSEPILVSSWENGGLVLQDARSELVYGTYGWDAATNTGSFTPNTALIPGATYTVSLGSIVDLAGNPLVRVGTWVIQPMILPAVSLTVAPRLVGTGSTVALGGMVVGGLGAAVVIEWSVGGGTWEPFVTVFPAADGSFTTGAEVDATSSFRADIPASSVTAEAVSSPVRVLVRREVQLAGGKASITRRVTAGTRVSLTAAVTPSDPPVPVTLSIYRYVTGRGYMPQPAVTRATVAGHCTFVWHPGQGSYYLQLTTPPSPLFANGVSARYYWVAH